MNRRWGLVGKRLFDVVVASFAIVLVAVPILVVWFVVALGIGRPVLFRQERLGLGGRPFTVLKFRTMRDAPADGTPVPDGERLTRLGKLLRASSIDELPSLVNILAGHMSIVGPRPLLSSYEDRYTPFESRRHEVRPGLTGLAQVNGRNAVEWADRLRLDVEYVDTMSPGRDAAIIFRTIGVVLGARGVSAPGVTTMHELLPFHLRNTACGRIAP